MSDARRYALALAVFGGVAVGLVWPLLIAGLITLAWIYPLFNSE